MIGEREFNRMTEVFKKQADAVKNIADKIEKIDSLGGGGVGKDVTGTKYTINGTEYTAGSNAEIFNDYLNNKAVGQYSHAEGSRTTALGYSSHTEGSGTKASGNYSHAEGSNTRASSDYQHVQGKYNIEDSSGKYAFIIGNGTSDTARSNVFAIDWYGNIYINNASTGVNVATLASDLASLQTQIQTLSDRVAALENA